MFNKLFGTNTNFDPDSTTNAIEDSISIRKTIDFPLLQAAWDEYIEIKKQDPDFLYGDTKDMPIWSALEKLEEYRGDFFAFSGEEQYMLRALKKGFLIYADVIHTLIDHHDDIEAAEHVFNKHPQIHDYLPEEYDNAEHVIEVLLEVAKDYQWQLEHFSDKHQEDIDAALEESAHLAAPRRSKMASE